MPLTITQLAERATREARGGFSEAESGITVDRAALLIPETLGELAEAVADDSRLRDLLTYEWTITLTNGQVDLSDADYDYLLRSKLCYSVAFDADDTERRNPLVWKKSAAQLSWGADVNFGYYALQGDKIVTRKMSSGSPIDMQSLVLIASYVPAIGSNAPSPNTFPLKPELEDDAVRRLAEKLIAGARVRI